MSSVASQPDEVRAYTKVYLFFCHVYSTGLSYDKSFVAVETVLLHLKQQIPSTARAMDLVMEDLIQQRVRTYT